MQNCVKAKHRYLPAVVYTAVFKYDPRYKFEEKKLTISTRLYIKSYKLQPCTILVWKYTYVEKTPKQLIAAALLFRTITFFFIANPHLKMVFYYVQKQMICDAIWT